MAETQPLEDRDRTKRLLNWAFQRGAIPAALATVVVVCAVTAEQPRSAHNRLHAPNYTSEANPNLVDPRVQRTLGDVAILPPGAAWLNYLKSKSP